MSSIKYNFFNLFKNIFNNIINGCIYINKFFIIQYIYIGNYISNLTKKINTNPNDVNFLKMQKRSVIRIENWYLRNKENRRVKASNMIKSLIKRNNVKTEYNRLKIATTIAQKYYQNKYRKSVILRLDKSSEIDNRLLKSDSNITSNSNNFTNLLGSINIFKW